MPPAPRLEARGEMDARNQLPIGIDAEPRTSPTAWFATGSGGTTITKKRIGDHAGSRLKTIITVAEWLPFGVAMTMA